MLKDRVAHARSGDAHQRADGGEGVAAVVPCAGHQGGRVELAGEEHRIAVHALLGDDGHDGGDQREKPGDNSAAGVTADNALQRVQADPGAGGGQNDGQDDGGHALHALVAVGVVLVGGAAGQAHAHNDDDAAEHVGSRVHGVADHGGGFADDAGKQLEDHEDRVADDAEVGDADGGSLKIAGTRYFRFEPLFHGSYLRIIVTCHVSPGIKNTPAKTALLRTVPWVFKSTVTCVTRLRKIVPGLISLYCS